MTNFLMNMNDLNKVIQRSESYIKIRMVTKHFSGAEEESF